jgi:ParB-like chromosome segregation protein Spo0J
MKIHPIATILPSLSDRQYEDLKESIQQNGLMNPLMAIERDGEQLLIDGRHRLRACAELGIKPVVDIYDADDSELGSLVWGANGIRRHLSPSQRAAFYSELCGAPAKQKAKARQEHKTAGGLSANLREAQKASQEIAEIAGVSARTVDDALAVQKADPELFQQVKDGKVSVSAAAKQVRAPKPEPDEPPAEKPKPKSDQASKVVELFRMMGDRRLGTLKQVIKTLESHERRVLLDFLEALVEGES